MRDVNRNEFDLIDLDDKDFHHEQPDEISKIIIDN